MKNHFFIPYSGNKRQEVEKINEHVNLDNITTIVEPFCGSCAFSYYISTLYPKKFNYVLNDNNEYLIQIFNILKSDEETKKLEQRINNYCFDENNIFCDKNKYNNIDDKLLKYIIHHKYYTIRAGLYPIKNRPKNKFVFEEYPFTKFIRSENISIRNNDAIEIYKKYKNNKNCFIFLDPPYLQCCNDFYLDSNTNIYEYLNDNPIKKEKSKIMLVLEKNWIINLLFNNYEKIEYDKKYECSKKKTTHMIIKNTR